MRVSMMALAAACLSLPQAVYARGPAKAPAPGRVTQEDRWAQALLQAWDQEGGGDKAPPSEAVRMVTTILKGGKMGGDSGWFGPGLRRHDWVWLGGRCDADRDGKVVRKEFPGPDALFARMDRDRDGAVTAADLDWSPESPFLKQEAQAKQMLRGIDADGDGKVSQEEWAGLFKKLARGRDHLTAEDLRNAFFSPPKAKGQGKQKKDGPARQLLLRCLLQGDLGSPFEGPGLDEAAPDFTLPRQDGKGQISLSEFRGKRPVVLIFGSFT